jgi:hypothetical protein
LAGETPNKRTFGLSVFCLLKLSIGFTILSLYNGYRDFLDVHIAAQLTAQPGSSFYGLAGQQHEEINLIGMDDIRNLPAREGRQINFPAGDGRH